jgi:hypothetical protein
MQTPFVTVPSYFLGLDLADIRRRAAPTPHIAEREGEMRLMKGTFRAALAALG